MKDSRTLLSYHSLTVEVENTPSEELVEHMHATVLGQPGGLRYNHADLTDRLESGHEDYFIYIRKSGKMLGSVGFCGKPAHTAGLDHDTWLIRYVSFKSPLENRPKKRKEKADIKSGQNQGSAVARVIEPVFADPAQLRHGKKGSDQPAIVYGVIDQTNLRSMNFSSRAGMESIRVMAGFSFSRLSPHSSENIRRVKGEEKPSIMEQLKEYYKDFTLFFTDPIFKDDDYYFISEGERMVVGLQTYPISWNILDFGSKVANRLMPVLKKFPWVRKRIGSDRISFLAFDAIYCEPGYEHRLYELMEGVLALKEKYIGMLMMDVDTDLYRIFEEKGKMGPLTKVMGVTYADIRARFVNIPDEVRKEFRDRPVYVPTYDNS